MALSFKLLPSLWTTRVRFPQWAALFLPPPRFLFWRERYRGTAVSKMTVFWDAAPCGLVEIDRRFRSAYCLHHQGEEYLIRWTPYALSSEKLTNRLHLVLSMTLWRGT
jgi:hypothetical protein